VTPDTPLRLVVAAAIAFPDGSMTAAGLRREARKTARIPAVAWTSETTPRREQIIPDMSLQAQGKAALRYK